MVQVSCLAGITPLVYAWEAQNTAGDTKRKCTSAVVLIGMCTGNVCFNPVRVSADTDMMLQVIGPQLYSLDQAPEYRPGLISNLIMFVLVAIIAMYVDILLSFVLATNRASIADVYLYWLNKRHAKKREALGKTAQIVDESMIGKNKIQASKAAEVEDSGKGENREVDKGFLDMTDLKNEDFIYVY